MRTAWGSSVSLRSVAIAVVCASSYACSAAPPTGSSPDPAIANVVAARPPEGAKSERNARVGETPKEGLVSTPSGACPSNMVSVGTFCIDRWEDSLVEMLPNGEERAASPFEPVGTKRVRAVSVAGVYPQGYISAIEASRACGASGKRLCRMNEWRKACRGPEKHTYGYADRRVPGTCNDRGRNPVIALYGRGRWNWSTMNQPVLNQLENTLSKTGDHEGCTNGFGVFDMVGNLHEWVADPNGTFYGGYYQDVASRGHGEGCGYETTAHEARYHDYSTGFRCCAELDARTH
jgi:hypothetical protein